MSEHCRSAVALIIFNRPDVTARVFAAIRAARPPTLFVIADGPRSNVANDAARCAAAREAINDIDWPCEVFRKFAPANLGLRRNVSEGLDWVFAQTEEAIILEDDCLPAPSFFSFCDALLDEYRDNKKVGMIAGINPDSSAEDAEGGGASYRFSRYPHIWGWATWRRAWKHYDDAMTDWPRLRNSSWLAKIGLEGSGRNFWRRHFDDCLSNRRDALNTWDLPWTFACWKNGLLSVMPRVNLVENLGFGPEAIHTKRPSRLDAMATGVMTFPLVHPPDIAADKNSDDWVQANICEGATGLERLFWSLRFPLPIWCVRRGLRWLNR